LNIFTETLCLQDSWLPQALHRPQLPAQAHQKPQLWQTQENGTKTLNLTKIPQIINKIKFQLLDDIVIATPAPKMSRAVENTPLPPLESIMRSTDTYSPCAVSDYMDNYSVMDTLHAGTLIKIKIGKIKTIELNCQITELITN
jgi:hypothetical protein